MSSYPQEPPAAYTTGSNANGFEGKGYDEKTEPIAESGPGNEYEIQHGEQRDLARKLKSRHMSMIAIGV